MSTSEPTVKAPVPIVSLEDDYLQTVVLAGELQSSASAAPASAPAAAPAAAPADANTPVAESTQVYCRVSDLWLSPVELREHYKTDWYRYNLKRSTRGLPPVQEAAFDDLVENGALNDEDELSGSDDDDDAEDESGGTSVAARPDGRVALRDAS